jgi:hypothetical protein
MTTYKPVAISKAAFAFCRLGLTALVWIALVFHSKPVMPVVFAILLLSAILKVQRAPMIVLYDRTFGRMMSSQEEIVNEHAMRFAHIMGSLFSLVCIILLYFVDEKIGWMAVFMFALLKSVSAFGFCPATKLYECSAGGSCCAFAKIRDKHK